MISDLKVTLNDFELSKYFDLTEEPDRGLFPEVEHNLVRMARNNGVRSASKRLAHRIITLELYALSGDFRKTKDELARVLFEEGRQELWFSDEPDRYWLVELTGDSSLKRSIDYRGEAYGQLQFLVEDGLAHSVDEKYFHFKEDTSVIENKGTYVSPVDIDVTFTSDANSIGFVSEKNIVQLGTSISEDNSEIVPSTKVSNDPMEPNSKNLWSVNVGKYRHNRNNGDNTSKVQGGISWNKENASPSSYGPAIEKDKPGYWHGPTLTRMLTTPLEDFEAYHRFEFKATGNTVQRASCQGIMEINYTDADGNFVIGFEMKDSESKKEQISYSFFVGQFRIFTGYLPTSVMKKGGGFFGMVMMKKIGNQFSFRIARLNIDKKPWKEEWSSPTKSWFNNTVSMLPVSQNHIFMCVWKNDRPIGIKIAHTRVTQYNSKKEALIPKTFYKDDNLVVDGKTNRVYINGIRDDSYRVIGSSQSFEVDKGETEVTAISDGTFVGSLRLRERYV